MIPAKLNNQIEMCSESPGDVLMLMATNGQGLHGNTEALLLLKPSFGPEDLRVNLLNFS